MCWPREQVECVIMGSISEFTFMVKTAPKTFFLPSCFVFSVVHVLFQSPSAVICLLQERL